MPGPKANTYAPPQWLTQDFLQSALREGSCRDSLSVSDFNIQPATNVGDNFLSQMFRASVKVCNDKKGTEDLSVIIKCKSQGEAAEVEEFFHELKVFSRETLMLAETLPLLQAVLDEVGGPKLYAHLYFKQEGPNSTLLMEDLCESGFRTVDRIAGLDIEHSLLVMEYIATFHAASLAVIAKNPEIKTRYKQCCWQTNNAVRVQARINRDISHLLTCLNKWKNFPDEMIRKVERWNEIGMEKVFQCTALNENDELNVLNHGDLWTPNIMFKYKKEFPFDLRFIDFQCSCFNSAAYDLHFFIFTSPNIDIRLSELDEMLTRYHEKLIQTCFKLKYPIKMTLADTKKMFYDRIAFGFTATFSIQTLIITDPADTTQDNKNIVEGQKNRGDNLAKNDKYKKVIETLLPFFDHHGVFD